MIIHEKTQVLHHMNTMLPGLGCEGWKTRVRRTRLIFDVSRHGFPFT